MKIKAGMTLKLQLATVLYGAVDRIFIDAGAPLMAKTPIILGIDSARATGTAKKIRTSMRKTHHMPAIALDVLVNKPARQTAIKPKPMMRAFAVGFLVLVSAGIMAGVVLTGGFPVSTVIEFSWWDLIG
jgi:hypothetical protein